jgi:DNA integrity scanning protein DisA with diadenylate cyclase activity
MTNIENDHAMLSTTKAEISTSISSISRVASYVESDLNTIQRGVNTIVGICERTLECVKELRQENKELKQEVKELRQENTIMRTDMNILKEDKERRSFLIDFRENSKIDSLYNHVCRELHSYYPKECWSMDDFTRNISYILKGINTDPYIEKTRQRWEPS